MASILSKPHRYQNEYVYVHSFSISQREILEALIVATGSSNWEIEQASAAKFYKEGQEKIAKGDLSGVFNLIFGAIFEEGHGQDYSSIRKISNEELGLPEEDLPEVVKKLVTTIEH